MLIVHVKTTKKTKKETSGVIGKEPGEVLGIGFN